MPTCARLRLPVVVLTAATSAVVLAAPSAEASTHSAHAFVSDTNHARVHHDRRQYRSRRHLTEVAERWAQWMANHRSLRHNPYLPNQCGDWRALGENIGRGRSESVIQRAFMHSPDHRDNILSRQFTQVGIGTARGRDGRLYVDEVFRRP